mgnify:CR=1 FL=1
MRKYFAEFIGTTILVFFGCGSAVASGALFSAMGMGLPVAFTTLLVAFAFGLAVMAVYYMTGGISGCHINPAVSLGMLITKRMSVKDFLGYIASQFVGGIAGAALLSVVIGGRTSLGANGYDSASTFGITMWMAILIEVILTFVFVSVFLSATEKEENRSIAGLVIGLTMTMTYIFGVPFTGASVNPARSLGPALLQGSDALSQVWVFIAAPLVGAAVAALCYLLLRMEPKKSAAAVAVDTEIADEAMDGVAELEQQEDAEPVQPEAASDGDDGSLDEDK